MRRIELLGGLRVFQAGDGEYPPITRFRTRKTGLLLAYLSLFPRRQHGREELIERFWPDLPIEAARDNLSGCLSSLRRLLDTPEAAGGSVAEPSPLSANRSAVWLNLPIDAIDVAAFDQAIDAASDHKRTPHARRDSLETAVSLYGGPLLPDVYEDWALREQTRLAQRFTQALITLAKLQEEMGDREMALSTARRARLADPFAEMPCEIEMRLLASLGQLGAARGAYQEFAAFLRQELDCVPSPPLQRFLRELDRIEPAHEASPPVSVPRDTASESPTIPVKSRLPTTLSRFCGREKEVEQLVHLLQGEDRPRLLTLVGPGGIGKTHLSLVTAARLAAAEPRLRLDWISLADVADERHFLPTLQQALGLQEHAELSSANRDPLEALSRRLSPEKGDVGAVVLLDNLEQLLGVDATLGRVPALLRALLERTPGLTFLATSRRILGLEGEQEFVLGPLPVPQHIPDTGEPLPNDTLVELRTVPSVGLFVERVRQVRADFVLTAGNAADVASICQRLGGTPLALEMAAAWARSLPVKQIRERLDKQLLDLQSRRRDLPARHRSLRATMQWSWELLDADLRTLFLHLCIFRGGFTHAAAEAVGDCDDLEMQDCLDRLQEHSLLMRRQPEDSVGEQSGEERYFFLEPIREWGLEKLAEDDAALQSARRRQARYFYQVAVESGSDTRRYRSDEQNVLQAISLLLQAYPADSAMEAERVVEGLYLTYCLTFDWYQRGMHRLAYQFLTDGLRRYRESVLSRGFAGDSSLFARALYYQGAHGRSLGRLDEAERCNREARECFEALDDRGHIAYCDGELGSIATERGNLNEAMQCYARAIAVGRDIADLDLMGRGLLYLGKIEHQLGKREDAYAHFLEALEPLRQNESWLAYVEVLLGRSSLYLEDGRTKDAQHDIEEGLDRAIALGNRREVGMLLGAAAAVAARQQKVVRALRLFASADRFIQESGTPLLPSEVQARSIATGGDAWRAEISPADAAQALARGRADSLEEAVTYARCHEAY